MTTSNFAETWYKNGPKHNKLCRGFTNLFNIFTPNLREFALYLPILIPAYWVTLYHFVGSWFSLRSLRNDSKLSKWLRSYLHRLSQKIAYAFYKKLCTTMHKILSTYFVPLPMWKKGLNLALKSHQKKPAKWNQLPWI